MQRNQEALEVFKKLETQYPDDRDVLQKLSQIYEKLGNAELATEYRKKFDPTSELVGKVMPDFSATDPQWQNQFHSSNIVEKLFYLISGQSGLVLA